MGAATRAEKESFARRCIAREETIKTLVARIGRISAIRVSKPPMQESYDFLNLRFADRNRRNRNPLR